MAQSNSATSKKTKLIYFIIVTLILLVIAVLIWAFQTGRLSSSADTGSATVMNITNVCSGGQQTENITWDAYAGATSYSVKVYKDSTWENIPNCYKITSRTCTYGPHDPHAYNFRVIAHTSSSNPLYGEKRATQCTETASPTPTTTGASTECTTGQKQCKGDVIQKCMNGSWASSTSCALSSQTCQNGACVSASTSSASPSGQLTLNSIVASCISGSTSTNQNNHLSWNKISSPSGYAFLIKSDLTGGEYRFGNTEVINESITEVDLIYPSIDNVFYKVVDRATQAIQSNEQSAENKKCSSVVPTSNPTIYSGTCQQKCQSQGLGNARCGQAAVYPGESACNVSETSTGETSDCQVPRTDQGEKFAGVDYKCCCSGGTTASPTSTITKPAKPTGVIIKTEYDDCDTSKLGEGQLCTSIAPDPKYILTWPDPANLGVGYYEVYNKDNPTTPIATFAGSTGKTLSYTLSGLECKKTYSYYVVAVNSAGSSDPSDTATVTSQICGYGTDIADKTVEGLQATASDSGVITLSWSTLDSATGYDIYDCSGKYIATTSKTSYLFTGMGCSKEYCYKVQAHDGAGNKSKFSSNAKVTSASCGGETSPASTTTLVSTGASLWFNIALALILALAIGYLIFRHDIWEKK